VFSSDAARAVFFAYLIYSLAKYVTLPILLGGGLLWTAETVLRKRSPKSAKAYKQLLTVLWALVFILPVVYFLLQWLSKRNVPL
jgi:hypothetical protein